MSCVQTDIPLVETVIDADEAFLELAELADYAARMPELSIQLYRLFDEGTPGLDCEIDSSGASTTDRVIARYKLPEQIKAWLIALRAGNWKPDNIDEGPCLVCLRDSA
jgi:hypothetical protein